MSFEIKPHGQIGPALQLLVCEQLTRVVELLHKAGQGAGTEAAHEVRKRIKKGRALLSLLREPLGDDLYRQEDGILQKTNRTLGSMRDAQMLLKTFEHFQRRFFPEKPPAFIRAIRENFVAHERRCSARLAQSTTLAENLASMRELVIRATHWTVQDYAWKELRKAVRRSYRRARDAYQDAVGAPTAPRLHRWRKRVKELGYHIRLLRRVCPSLMEELAQDFKVLGEFLGDDHDLVVLRTALEERREALQNGPALETLLELIDLRRSELLDTAFDLGERLHAETPSDFVQELDELRTAHQQRRRKAKKLAAQLADIP